MTDKKKISRSAWMAGLGLTGTLMASYWLGYAGVPWAGRDQMSLPKPNRFLPRKEGSRFDDVINGIKVYSDQEDFSRLEGLMNDLGVTSEKYPVLHGIGYYYESPDGQCYGAYYSDTQELYITKCDSKKIFRDHVGGEHFILAHELGHYIFDMIETYEQDWADDYAEELLKERGLR